MAMETVLVTGFEPFGGHARNPSELAAQALDGRALSGARVVGTVLPCVFGRARSALAEALDRARPSLVVAVGQAGGRATFALERVAINVDDARISDNAGAQPVDLPIEPEGPVAYWSTLPIKAIVAALRARALPAEVSQTAGTFVCNHVFYALMHELVGRPGVRGGFVHVPQLPEQAEDAATCMPLERIVEGLEIVITTALGTRRDLREEGGALH